MPATLPNARFLIAGKEDLTRARRKLLTARIASGEWDGVVVTHSSFERIGMSRDYQAQFLREQIAEYEQLLGDHERAESGRARRNIIKTIEKQKARRAERLRDLLAEDKKDHVRTREGKAYAGESIVEENVGRLGFPSATELAWIN
jgi:N12 class adenine-specific DNA methylase